MIQHGKQDSSGKRPGSLGGDGGAPIDAHPVSSKHRIGIELTEAGLTTAEVGSGGSFASRCRRADEAPAQSARWTWNVPDRSGPRRSPLLELQRQRWPGGKEALAIGDLQVGRDRSDVVDRQGFNRGGFVGFAT